MNEKEYDKLLRDAHLLGDSMLRGILRSSVANKTDEKNDICLGWKMILD